MDIIVALIRNGACCVKDLRLLPYSVLHDPSYTAKFYRFPGPHLDQTTPLEVIISLAQLYGCISLSLAGLKMLSSKGVFKLLRLNRTADLFQAANRARREKRETEEKEASSKKQSSSKPDTTANTCDTTDTKADSTNADTAEEFIRKSLAQEANAALRGTWEGMALFVTGVGFFWFSAHSLHVTGTGWIGGLPAFIHALLMMQMALVYFLYTMYKDSARNIRRSKQALLVIEELSAIDDMNKKYKKDKNKKEVAVVETRWLTFETYNLLLGDDWNPFWAKGDVSSVDRMAEGKMFEKEIELLKSNVKSFTESEVIMDSKTAARLEKRAETFKWEGYREFGSLIFNCFAFYGYAMALVSYYFDDEETQPGYIKNCKFGYSNMDADWTGNFVGDVMWTVEPIFIVSMPIVMRLMSKRETNKKIKSD